MIAPSRGIASTESGPHHCGSDTIQGYELALRKKYFLALAITGFALKEKTDATPPAK
jgi:hypothetical protein